jgi:molybdopterin-guanine dinucleotide biosynthesis protein A
VDHAHGDVGVVLCGGSSRRMGVDKATMSLGGSPLADRAVAALRRSGVSEVLTVGGDGARLAGLADGHLLDRYPGEGPLGGVATAALARPGRTLVVVACDLPDLDGTALSGLRRSASGGRAVVPVLDGVAQWAVAVLPADVAAAAAARFVDGARSLRDGYGDVDGVELAGASWLSDLDTQADVDRWLGRSGDRG